MATTTSDWDERERELGLFFQRETCLAACFSERWKRDREVLRPEVEWWIRGGAGWGLSGRIAPPFLAGPGQMGRGQQVLRGPHCTRLPGFIPRFDRRKMVASSFVLSIWCWFVVLLIFSLAAVYVYYTRCPHFFPIRLGLGLAEFLESWLTHTSYFFKSVCKAYYNNNVNCNIWFIRFKF